MEQLTYERLQENLNRLKLTRAAEVLDTIVSHAEKSEGSYLSFLDHLLEEEVAAKEKRRITTAMKTAGLPFAKTIEEYDFSFHPQLDKKAVMELFDLTFIPKHENVIFLGPPGVGKTHLAISLAIKACCHGFKVYFTTMNTLISKLKESQSKGKAYLNSSLVIVDEVGYLPVDSREAYLFSSSSLIAMRKAPRSSRQIRALQTGRSSSGTQLLPLLSSTGFSTTARSLTLKDTVTD